MSVTRPIRVGVALLSAVAALLAGCSADEPKAQAPTTSISEPSASASPQQPRPPALPVAAHEDTKQGAKAYISWYLQSLVYAANTGDVNELQIASARCSGCDDYVSLYRKVYGRGGYFRSVKWTPVTWSITSASSRTSRVLVAIRAAEARYKPSADEDVVASEQYDDAFVFEITRRTSSWSVSTLTSGKA